MRKVGLGQRVLDRVVARLHAWLRFGLHNGWQLHYLHETC